MSTTYTGPLPGFMIGKFIESVLVSPVTFNGTIFTINTGTDLGSGQIFDGMTISLEAETEQIVPTNYGVDNQVITLDGMNISVSEMLTRTGLSALMNLYSTSDYFRVAASVQPPGSGSATAIFAAILGRKSCDTEYVRGKNTMKLTGVTCGVAPYYGSGTPPF